MKHIPKLYKCTIKSKSGSNVYNCVVDKYSGGWYRIVECDNKHYIGKEKKRYHFKESPKKSNMINNEEV